MTLGLLDKFTNDGKNQGYVQFYLCYYKFDFPSKFMISFQINNLLHSPVAY